MQNSSTNLLFDMPVSSAVISDCGQYRYSLTRIWDDSKPKVLFVMLNPSTADGTKDDRTIRRCKAFAESWGYGGLYVCNLFAYRATNPEELLKVNNPFGDQNIWVTRKLIDEVEMVVCAWGNRKIINKIITPYTEVSLLNFCKEKLHYIEMSIDGTPKHPLYLNKDLLPKKWTSVRGL
jgi:hypothetical protein